MNHKQIAICDTETTGLLAGSHEIIEIAIITNDCIYHHKIKPLRIELADPIALKVNGYNPKDWENAIHPNIVAKDIAYILKDKIIVGHNPNFDYEFIKELLEEQKVSAHIDHRCVDTMTLAFVHLAPLGLKSLSLDSIRAFLGWKTYPTHNALRDAQDTKRLYKLLSKPNSRYFLLKWGVRLKRFFGLIPW